MLEPISTSDWDRVKAAHLFARAGFGATASEIEQAAGQSPAEVVERLVAVEKTPESWAPPDWVTPDSELRPDLRAMRELSEEKRKMAQRERRMEARDEMQDLRFWWLQRMRTSPRPLQEKLTLFWHGHFATSMEKVRSSYALYRQNETLRKHAFGSWRDLLVAVGKDPAMLIYLDNAHSRKEHPNENFARELMELFTLGEGHYTEEDIKEAARAFTGWTLHPQRFAFIYRANMHDSGGKKFMGRRGALTGEDIIDTIVAQPQARLYIAEKIWRFFAYDEPEPELVFKLGASMGSKMEFRPLLRTLLLSREFYSARALRTQIKSPVQWLVGLCKSLDAELPPPPACSFMLRLLGQELFAPPNVKGWDGGYAWITTATLLYRYNLAGLMIRGGRDMRDLAGDLSAIARLAALPSIVDAKRVLPASARSTVEETQKYLHWRLYQGPLRKEDFEAVRQYLSDLSDPSDWSDQTVRRVIHTMVSMPQFQLT
jgi:uncharacterized protein (DUF1800 family)